MSGLERFLKPNVESCNNIKYVASKRFLDGDNKPIEWEIKSISSQDDENLRRNATKRIPVNGRRNQYTNEIDNNKYVGLLAVACTVYPNLNDEKLQNSYGVMGADVLLKTMLLPGEYANYLNKIQEICGFDLTHDELKDDAVNL